jgi:hypothetical protein
MNSPRLERGLLADTDIGSCEYLVILSTWHCHKTEVSRQHGREKKCSAWIPGTVEPEAGSLQIAECDKVCGKRAHAGSNRRDRDTLGSCPLGGTVLGLEGASSS